MTAYYSRDPDNPRRVLHIRRGDSGETWCFQYMALGNPIHKDHMKRVAPYSYGLSIVHNGQVYRVCKDCLRRLEAVGGEK